MGGRVSKARAGGRPYAAGALVLLALWQTEACTSTSGLSGGDDDAGAPPDEAGTTTPARDASTAPDAGDAGGDALAPRPTYCAELPGAHDLCDDFDDVGPVGAKWSGKNQIGGTFLRVDGGTSAPFALGAIAQVTATDISLEREWVTAVRTVTCELDMRVASFGQPSPEVLKVSLVSPQVSRYELTVTLGAAGGPLGTRFDEYKESAGGGAFNQGEPLVVPPLGKWQHWRIDVVAKPNPIGGGPPRAAVLIDGQPAASIDIQPPTDVIARARFKLGIKNGINGATNDWRIDFDNVVCDVQ